MMKKNINKIKRKLRNRKKLKDINVNRYRISVSKSLNNLSAQIIEEVKSKFSNLNDIRLLYEGGFPSAERKRICFLRSEEQVKTPSIDIPIKGIYIKLIVVKCSIDNFILHERVINSIHFTVGAKYSTG